MQAFFRRSLVLTYALPKEELNAQLGKGLVLDTYDDVGFLAIAMVETESLRPKGAPLWMGRDFFLSGYRIFARLERPGRPSLRGLKILRSDTDKTSMAFVGNIFTRYAYARAKVRVASSNESMEVEIQTKGAGADLHVVADLREKDAPLPEGSPFRNLADARSFAGPLPHTFDYEEKSGKMVVIKGLRKAWEPRPVRAFVKRATFLDAYKDARLANAFYLENIPYEWKPGRLEDIA